MYRYERHLVLPKILAQNCPEDFSQTNTIYNANPQKCGTARRQYAGAINKGRGQTEVNSYTLEVSALGYKGVLRSFCHLAISLILQK